MSTFTWRGQELELFDDPYNATITNERAVEIPIAADFLHRMVNPDHGVGLEVGNVLDHYGFPHARRVVDLYERSPFVENIDLFDIKGTFDWIVSVSTIEHVRFPENPWAPVAALWYLFGLLRPGGSLLVTAGAGQSSMLDGFFITDGTSVTLARDCLDCGWQQTPTPEVREYGPEHGARSVWIGEWKMP